MDLSRFPRRRYSTGPTPLEPLPRFSAALAAQCPGGRGPEVWIKRDDQLGLFPGGNKTRKLEFLVADALASGADTLITCGAPQSNHCRITLSAAVKEGLRCRFVIEERVPHSFREDANGNHFLFRLMGVESLRVVPAGTDMTAEMQREDEVLRQRRTTRLRHSGGRFECDRRPRLRELRAGTDGAELRHGRSGSTRWWSGPAVRGHTAACSRACSASTGTWCSPASA